MKCVYCNENFYIKRNILDLFKIEKEYICNRCYKKYKIDISVEKIQLDKYDCTIVSMFKRKYYIEYIYFYKEYSKLYKALSKRENSIVLFYDEIKMNDAVFSVLDGISKLFQKDLILLVFHIQY